MTLTEAQRDPWRPPVEAYPRFGSPTEKLVFAVRYAILAPSSHNTQPWLFMVREQALELFADRTRALAVIDPDDRELVMSCGAALFHLTTALRHFGNEVVIARAPQARLPDLLAQIRIASERPSTPEESRLFAAIPQRRTNRRPFEPRPIPPSVLGALQEIAREHHGWLSIIDELRRYPLGELIAEGDRIQYDDPRFRRELAAWTHANRSRSRDGIPGASLGQSELATRLAPLLARAHNTGNAQAQRDRETALGAPVLAVLGSEGDGPGDWLAAGEALSHVLLHARSEGVSASYLNSPIQVPLLREKVRRLIEKNGHPHLILRLGFASEIAPTPRRPIEDVLL